MTKSKLIADGNTKSTERILIFVFLDAASGVRQGRVDFVFTVTARVFISGFGVKPLSDFSGTGKEGWAASSP